MTWNAVALSHGGDTLTQIVSLVGVEACVMYCPAAQPSVVGRQTRSVMWSGLGLPLR